MAKSKPKFRRGSEEHKAFLREIGAKGGRANVAKNGSWHMAKIGARGGETMKQTRGSEFYSMIGKIGSRKQWGKEDES